MSLIAPLNFLFAGLLGIIVLLYMLRLKRKERVVPSTLLWQSALRDLQANAPWQKLRSSLLMWLQLGFLILAVLALVRPAMKILASGGQTVAIIIDSSASMKATDVSPSRYERARSQAGQLISRLASTDSGTVIAAGMQTRVLAPLTQDKNVLKRAVGNAKAQDTSCNLREAIVLAASLLRGKKNPQIYVLSDGAVPTLQDLSVGDIGLQFVKIGQRGDNLAMTALDARRGYSGSSQAQVFATITNYSAQEREVKLELARNGDLVEVRPVTVPAAKPAGNGGERVPGQASELFDNLPFEDGLFSAHFDYQDDLETDNTAYTRLNPPRKIKVLLTADNLFLERALNVDPNVQLFTGKPSANNQDFDVVVCDGSVPPNLPDTNQLIFNTTTPLTPVQVTGVAPQPSVADFDRTHPVARYAPWTDIRFAQSMAVKVKSWGAPVVEAERTPLIVAGERGGKRVVWAGFDLRETDLPLRVAFPIFVTNSLQWLTAPRGPNSNAEGASQRTGQPVPLLPPSGTKDISITAPDKSVRRIPVAQDSDGVLYDGTDQVGLYSASAGNWKDTFAVSLLNKAESDLAPRDALKVGENKQVQAETRARSNRELWGYLIAIALLVLVVEWWVYHRGV